MARLEHYTKRDTREVISEANRTASRYKNDVDPNRTCLNYGYGGYAKTTAETQANIMTRCDEIMQGRKMQKQTNVISSWVITYPSDRCTPEKWDTGETNKKGEPIYKTYNKPNDPDDCRRFMDITYRFACDRYGADNVIAGYVHMDETTPHIEIMLVPEAVSRKTGKVTVSSASLFTKNELQGSRQGGFQYDLEQVMRSEFGVSGMIINGRTRGNYTTDELKQRDRDARMIRRGKRQNRDAKAKNDELFGKLKICHDEQVNRQKLFEEQERELNRREAVLQHREQALNERKEEQERELNRREAVLQRREQALNEREEEQREAAENIAERTRNLLQGEREYSHKKEHLDRYITETARKIASETNERFANMPSDMQDRAIDAAKNRLQRGNEFPQFDEYREKGGKSHKRHGGKGFSL